MSNATLQQNAVSQLAAQAEAMGRLALDSGAFAAAVAAFESNDPDAFRWVLQRLEIVPECELICEWIRVKLCGLRCVEVCGPLDPEVQIPNLRQFAEAVIRLASDRALLRRIVDAVSCGDAETYHAAVAAAKLEGFCHLLCRYVCSTVYRRICEIVCTPRQTLPQAADPALDIEADAEALRRIVANEKLLAAIEEAEARLDCEVLNREIGAAGFIGDCEIICRLICVWRCVRVCRLLCREPPPILTGSYAIDEARKFALAARPLAGQPRALSNLVAAVVESDAEAFGAIVNRFGLGPYCWQVCGWVCSETCYEFCICVCPPQQKPPLFTYVGHFDIYTDIDSGTGKTNKGLSFSGLFFNGGPNFAFQGPLQLAGYCPIDSPAFPGVQMKYRFLYTMGGGSPVPITGPLVSPVQVGTQAVTWPTKSAANTAILPMQTLHPAVLVSAAPPSSPVAPALGSAYADPTPFNLQPDPDGWIAVDPNVDASGFSTLLGFQTTEVPGLAGGAPFPGFNSEPGGSPAGSPAPVAAQGADLSITFEATRVGVPTIDYTNSLAKIHINNWSEVNNLWLKEFMGAGGCCTPITDTVSVQYTADHEQMTAGGWSLSIKSCSPSAPGQIAPASPNTTLAVAINDIQGTITVASSAGFPAAPFSVWLGGTGEIMQVTSVAATTWTVTRGASGTIPESAAVGAAVQAFDPPGVTDRGGSGTIVENTTAWTNCSYQVWLSTRAGLTTGLLDNQGYSNLLTFCICGH